MKPKHHDAEAEFYALANPTDRDVEWVANTAWKRIEKVLKKHGRLPEDEHAYDALSDEEPVLAHCYSQSTHGTSGLRVIDESKARTLSSVQRPVPNGPMPRAQGTVAQVGAINVHADTVIDGRDRKRLERLVRYIARPPIAQDRLEVMRDGQVKYTMKKAWRDGTTSVVLKPHDFIKRLCAMVPPPYLHMTRFYGVLAPHASMRGDVVTQPEISPPVQLQLFATGTDDSNDQKKTSCRQTWSKLLARVFRIDVTVCPKCSGTMKIIDAVTTNDDVKTILGNHTPRDGPTTTSQMSLM